MVKSLKHKAAAGMIWTALQKYSTMFIGFISGIILARLLTPYDYGCIGMLSIFMVLAESFIDGGFGSALIQKKNPTQEDYSTIFFWNISMACILYAVLYLCAPTIARFYNISQLSSVLRVQGIILFIYAFNIVQRNQLRKNLNFRLLSIVTIVTSLISLAITIVMAYHGYGVWALVAQNIITAAIPTIAFWFLVKWRPRLVFSIKAYRELFGFGFYMFLTHLINQFGQQIQGLLIGKFYNPTTMGYYSKASGTEKLASSSISQVMTQVTYPLYAEAQNNLSLMQNMIRRLSMSLSYLTFPLMFILILLARPIFVLLYSDRWLQSVPYFQVLCFAGLAYSLQSVNYQSISAIGKSKLMFQWTLVKRIMGLLFVVIGLLGWGMEGLLVGVILNTWFSYFVNIGLVSKEIGYKWWKQLLDISPMLTISAIAAFLSYLVGNIFKFSLFYDGMIKLLVFTTIYLTWSFVYKPESFIYIKSFYVDLKKKKNSIT